MSTDTLYGTFESLCRFNIVIMGDISQLDYLISSTATTVLAVEQLSLIIHKSPASIRSDASRNPSALPPICRLPGNKRLLWRLEDVQSWLASFVERTSSAAHVPSADIHTPKKRGRPRKTEQRGIA